MSSPSFSFPSSLSPPLLDSPHLHRFVLFETANLFIISGSDKARTSYRLLCLDRNAPSGELKCWEESETFSALSCQQRINSLIQKSGNAVEKVTTFAGILGFLRLPQVYLIMIVKKERVGQIGGRWIYNIQDWRAKLISNERSAAAANNSGSSIERYKGLLRGMDLTKDFYFSYYYDLTNTLQNNFSKAPQAFETAFEAPKTRSRGRATVVNDPAAEPGAELSDGEDDYRSGPEGAPNPGSATAGYWRAPSPSVQSDFQCYNEQFLWNYYLTREFLRQLPHASYWLVPLIHGFFQQHAFNLGNRKFLLTLIARRSRHFAGPRYLKRGVQANGHVANEVESEQIVQEQLAYSEGVASFSSVVILRGSIPLYWAQENIKTMKPDIVVYSFDREYEATQSHLSDLRRRYGLPIAVLSLIKKKESQETKLGDEFTTAIKKCRRIIIKNQQNATQSQGKSAALPPNRWIDVDEVDFAPDPAAELADPSAPLIYRTYDFLNERGAKANVLRDLKAMIKPLVDRHSFFTRCAPDPSAIEPIVSSLQNGIIRVNCIDCLDRTNVAQFCIARYALAQQLRALGLGEFDELPYELLVLLQAMFTAHGDRIAHQYAGSGAMHKDALVDREEQKQLESDRTQEDAKKKGPSGGTASGIASNALSAVKRYYSNNVTDIDKQLSINLFLGNYIPSAGKAELWSLDPAAQHLDCELVYGNENHNFKLAYKPQIPAIRIKSLARRNGESCESLDSATAALRKHRFYTFFNEKYNPKSLTSYEKELRQPFFKSINVQNSQGSEADENGSSLAAWSSSPSEDGEISLNEFLAPPPPEFSSEPPIDTPQSPRSPSSTSTSPPPPPNNAAPATPTLVLPAPKSLAKEASNSARSLFSTLFKKDKKKEEVKKVAPAEVKKAPPIVPEPVQAEEGSSSISGLSKQDRLVDLAAVIQSQDKERERERERFSLDEKDSTESVSAPQSPSLSSWSDSDSQLFSSSDPFYSRFFSSISCDGLKSSLDDRGLPLSGPAVPLSYGELVDLVDQLKGQLNDFATRIAELTEQQENVKGGERKALAVERSLESAAPISPLSAAPAAPLSLSHSALGDSIPTVSQLLQRQYDSLRSIQCPADCSELEAIFGPKLLSNSSKHSKTKKNKTANQQQNHNHSEHHHTGQSHSSVPAPVTVPVPLPVSSPTPASSEPDFLTGSSVSISPPVSSQAPSSAQPDFLTGFP